MMPSMALLVTKMVTNEYSAISILPNTITANTTTSVSMHSSSVLSDRFGNTRLSSSVSRSVPPVEMPRANSTPMPTPMSAPPKPAASSGLFVYGGTTSESRSMNTDSSTVAASVLHSGRKPSFHHATAASGTLSSSDHAPTVINPPVTCVSAVARPDTPPGAMSFGIVNIASPSATSAVPAPMAAASSSHCFVRFFMDSAL